MRGPSPSWLQELDHTADAGIVVEAPDLAELFARVAWGMFALITDPETVEPRIVTTLSVQAPDRPALLVRWLAELNFRHVTQHRLFSAFKIRRLEEDRLEAEVGGEDIDPRRHVVYTEIKAVTFHGLRLEQEPHGWRAQIIFDL